MSSGTLDAPPTILEAAFTRYNRIVFPHVSTPSPGLGITELSFDVESSDESHPQLETDEAYNLTVPKNGVAKITAKTVYGALRGLETFSQLVTFSFEEGIYVIETAPWNIIDKPRFPHRGLMIDTARHFQNLASIRGIVDSLPFAKLNVLHWHMVDTQSFPFQSKSSPKLWDGAYSKFERYTQQDVASIVEYARMRGVRVIVEFDMPGHAASWCKGYPEICPSSTCLQPLNVASNATFTLIDGLIDELAGAKDPLFKDNFVHLGGDEVDTSCWSKTPAVAAWLKQRNMTPDDGYAYFVKKVAGMVLARKHRPVQWSEVFDHFKGSLPKETIVHVWKDVTNVTEVVALGYDVLRNVGYDNVSWYLDNLNVKWDAVYQNEPCQGIPTDDLCAKVLGGHGEMWGETVDGSDLQQTVWPRLAAIAEKLWSSRLQTQDVAAAAQRIRDFRCLLLQRGVAAAPVDNANARSAPQVQIRVTPSMQRR
jgi:hexosaminidase